MNLVTILTTLSFAIFSVMGNNWPRARTMATLVSGTQMVSRRYPKTGRRMEVDTFHIMQVLSYVKT